jgi:hypothetical protein
MIKRQEVIRRLALNRPDLVLGLLFVVAGTVLATYFFAGSIRQGGTNSTAAALLSGWIIVLLACLGGVIKITLTRQTLISLLASEIRAIQYGLRMMDMFDFWASVYETPEHGPRGFADQPRKEEYFEIFHSVSSNIGNLHPDVVEAVVRFYTYLKMSRDAAAALQNWDTHTEADVRRLNVKHVMLILCQSMLWGAAALQLMGFKASDQDRRMRDALEASYDRIFGVGSFKTLKSDHVRRVSIEAFY